MERSQVCGGESVGQGWDGIILDLVQLRGICREDTFGGDQADLKSKVLTYPPLSWVRELGLSKDDALERRIICHLKNYQIYGTLLR